MCRIVEEELEVEKRSKIQGKQRKKGDSASSGKLTGGMCVSYFERY